MLSSLSLPARANWNVASADGFLVIVTAKHVMWYTAEDVRFGPSTTPLDDRQSLQLRMDHAEVQLREGDTAGARASLTHAVNSPLPARLRAWAEAQLIVSLAGVRIVENPLTVQALEDLPISLRLVRPKATDAAK